MPRPRAGGKVDLTRFIFICWFLAALAAHAAEPSAVTPDGARYYGPLHNGRFQGHGRLEWDNGTVYEGAFADGVFSGRGRLSGSDGRRYEGDFARGQFHGRGRYSRPDGARYRGEFLKWRLHGQGRYVDTNGDIYEGEFKNGQLEGEGKVTYARARPDGRTEAHGTFHNWRLAGDPERGQAGLAVESALLLQRRLLDEALAAIAPGRPGVIDMYLLAIAGDGSQEVFRREAEYVRAQFDERYGTKGRSVALVNSRNTATSAPMATQLSITETVNAIAARMNRDEDILFLFLTSHGSRSHELALRQNHMTLRDLPARELGHLLKESSIRWKVIVVSACYSGGFIEPLRDDWTLIITASRHDRTSFGCTDEAEFTYFGRAFFKESLPVSRSFQDAFSRADALVSQWEKKDQPKEERSLPQIHSTQAINQQLQRWWSQTVRGRSPN